MNAFRARDLYRSNSDTSGSSRASTPPPVTPTLPGAFDHQATPKGVAGIERNGSVRSLTSKWETAFQIATSSPTKEVAWPHHTSPTQILASPTRSRDPFPSRTKRDSSQNPFKSTPLDRVGCQPLPSDTLVLAPPSDVESILAHAANLRESKGTHEATSSDAIAKILTRSHARSATLPALTGLPNGPGPESLSGHSGGQYGGLENISPAQMGDDVVVHALHLARSRRHLPLPPKERLGDGVSVNSHPLITTLPLRAHESVGTLPAVPLTRLKHHGMTPGFSQTSALHRRAQTVSIMTMPATSLYNDLVREELKQSALISKGPVIPAVDQLVGDADNVADRTPRKRMHTEGAGMICRDNVLPVTIASARDAQSRYVEAYEYLCHVEEARQWLMETLRSGGLDERRCADELNHDSAAKLEAALQNGIALALVARLLLGSDALPRIHMERNPLTYRHLENIDSFLTLARHHHLPRVYMFEINDLYNAANMPQVLLCIRTLSHLLADRALAPRIKDLCGRLEFSESDLENAQRTLEAARIHMLHLSDSPDTDASLEAPSSGCRNAETEIERLHRLLRQCETQLFLFPARARGHTTRRRFRHDLAKYRLRHFESDTLPRFQAHARRRITLDRHDDRARELRRFERSRLYCRFQSACRAKVTRQQFTQMKRSIARQAYAIRGLQALARGNIIRHAFKVLSQHLRDHTSAFARLQAHVHGAMTRKHMQDLRGALQSSLRDIARFQSCVRGRLVRRHLLELHARLHGADIGRAVARLQAVLRGQALRRLKETLRAEIGQPYVTLWVSKLQRAIRAIKIRRQHSFIRERLEFVLPDVLGAQKAARGYLARKYWIAWRDYLRTAEVDAAAAALQALFRGALKRRSYYDRLSHYHHHESQIVLVQAVVRQKQQRRLYGQLMDGRDVSIDAIKNFLDLLRDSAFDFSVEMALEELQHQIVEKIRLNQAHESKVADLERKVELLVKGKITLDEVQRARKAGQQVEMAKQQLNDVLMAARDPFALGSLDNATRRKLELYQKMFYLLQTQPGYLARLLHCLREFDAANAHRCRIENIVFVTFAYAQQSREEYLLLKVCQQAIEEAVTSARTMQEFLRSNSAIFSLMKQYGQCDKQRQYLVDVFVPLIEELTPSGHNELELMLNPLDIYHACVNKEEQETGRVSSRTPNPTHQDALEDAETRTIYIHGLQTLRKLSNDFLGSICSPAKQMPFGMRWLVRELRFGLRTHFPEEDDQSISRIAGHILFCVYLQAAFAAPEKYGILDGSARAVPSTYQKLDKVCTVLGQIALCRPFDASHGPLTPLNDFVVEASLVYQSWFLQVVDVGDADAHFHAHQYMDFSAARQPIVSISPSEIYNLHGALLDNMGKIAPASTDPLRILLEELGDTPSRGSNDLTRAREGEIRLILNSHLPLSSAPRSSDKILWTRTKRFVLAHIKVQPGTDLLESLLLESDQTHEDLWNAIAVAEIQEVKQTEIRRLSMCSPKSTGCRETADDELYAMSFVKVKEAALSGLLQMESMDLVDRADGFQAMVDAIADDIRTKGAQRARRRADLERMTATIDSLDAKAKYLQEQLKLFNVYAESAMSTMHKQTKRRIVLPWTRQGRHERWLAKNGLRYKYGSYAFSATDLQKQGVLLSINHSVGVDIASVELIISCREEGIFEVQAKVLGMTVATSVLHWEDLLDAQFNGARTLNIDDVAKVKKSQPIATPNQHPIFTCVKN